MFPRSHVAYWIELTCPLASDGMPVHSGETRPTLLAFGHSGLLFGKRLDTILLRRRIRKCIRIHRPRVIGFVTNLFFAILESGFKYIRLSAKFGGCVWTEAVIRKIESCGFHNFRIRACEQGLSYINTCNLDYSAICLLSNFYILTRRSWRMR